MPQFDVYRSARGQGYLLDGQSDLIDSFETRVVIPLVPQSSQIALPHIQPSFDIAGHSHILATQLIFAIPLERLGKPVTSFADKRYDIMRAIDMLRSGI